MRTYLLCYDVAEPRRLAKVRKICYAHALGGQKSALEVPLRAYELRELTKELTKVIDPQQDRVHCIVVKPTPLCLGKTLSITMTQGAIIL